jgi:hypothetical protein
LVVIPPPAPVDTDTEAEAEGTPTEAEAEVRAPLEREVAEVGVEGDNIDIESVTRDDEADVDERGFWRGVFARSIMSTGETAEVPMRPVSAFEEGTPVDVGVETEAEVEARVSVASLLSSFAFALE